jgi:hypothetical protein
MLAVFGANAACVCHSAAAAAVTASVVGQRHAQPSGSKPSHSCCKHTEDQTPDSQPQPAKSHGGCRHCAGLVTTAAVRPTSDGIPVGLELQAPAFTLAAIPSVVPNSESALAHLAREFAIPHPTTLVRLHCALNL